MIFLFSTFFVLLVPAGAQQPQVSDSVKIRADEELRWGVISFHQGLFNKAILSFEKSLALDSEKDLTRFWLGRSYYQSGYEKAALNEWENLAQSGAAGTALQNFIKVIDDRRGLARELRTRGSLVELFDIPANQGGINYYNRPVSVASSPEGDGSFYLLSFANGNLVRVTATGGIHHVTAGGVLGFDRPWDIAFLPDKRMLISEYGADRISLCNTKGLRELTIGSTGSAEGELLGPQFLAVSPEGYIYVSEWGNRRISKFSSSGEFILSFGSASGSFPGFKGPSGLAIQKGFVYAADAVTGRIDVFDESGNFIKNLISEGLKAPEGLLFSSPETMLIADTDRILSYDLEHDVLSEASNLNGKGRRVLSICQDENGNIICPDFDGNTVSVMTDISTLYAGLFIKISRIDTSAYPEVHVDLLVEDRWGKAIVGLDARNFHIREQNVDMGKLELTYRGSSARGLDLAIVIDKKQTLKKKAESMKEGIREIFKNLQSEDRPFLLGAMDSPQLIAEPRDAPQEALTGMMKGWSPEIDTAAALRLGASNLIPGRQRKALIFLTDGKLAPNTFMDYNLQDMARYMINNGIRFYPLYLSEEAGNRELDYIAAETGGHPQYLFQPRGILPLLEQLRNEASPCYTLTFKSPGHTDFGRKYIPLSVEVNFIRKSGRDELGYYAPLEY